MVNLFTYEKETYYNTEYKNYSEIKNLKNINNEDFFTLAEVVPIEKTYLDGCHLTWTALHHDLKKESFEKHILNELWSVSLTRNKILIEKTEDKVRIKFYYYNINKSVGKKFYKKQSSVFYYSYNFKTNSFYEGNITSYHKKRKFSKRVRRTSPWMAPINSIRNRILSMVNSDNNLEMFNKPDYGNNILNIFINSIPNIEQYKDIQPIDHRIYKMIFDKYGVKLPNNWANLIFITPQPKIKQIRKCKNKYIDAIMLMNNLKGDKIRRILHNISHLNPHNIHIAIKTFGEGFLLQQPDSFWIKLFEFNYYLSEIVMDFSKNEKKNMFEIFKLMLELEIGTSTFYDHINFYRSVRRFEPIKWKSNDLKSFTQEHLDWTERNDFYTKGDYKRIYEKNFIDTVQEIIKDSKDETYYPVLLTTSRDYNEESFIQSNCVKGYITKASSVIISLRKNSVNSKERATIEFSIKMDRNMVYLMRVQTLGRFNQRLDDTWDVPIALLDSSVRHSMSSKKDELPKLEVKFGHNVFIANGVFERRTPLIILGQENKKNKYDVPLQLVWDRGVHPNEPITIEAPVPNIEII